MRELVQTVVLTTSKGLKAIYTGPVQLADGDLVTCGACGKRYVCRDLGEGKVEVVEEVPT